MNIIDASFFSSIEQIIIVGFVVLLGQFIYSAIGFGSGMVTVSIYAILYGDVKTFVPFFLLICLPAELYISFMERKHIDFREMSRFLLYIIPPTIVGTYFLKRFSGEGIVLLLGIIIVSLALFYLFFEDSLVFQFKSKLWMPLFGTLSGILGAMYGIAGPPLIVYFKTKKVDKTYFRVILLSIFLFMSILKLVTYTGFGLYSGKILMGLIPMLPFSILGLYLGNRAHHRLPERLFKRITSMVLLVSGVILIIK